MKFPRTDEVTDATVAPEPLARRIARAEAHVRVLRYHVSASIQVAREFDSDPTSDEYKQSVGIIESLESDLLDNRIALALLKVEKYSGSREGVALSLESMVQQHEARVAAPQPPDPSQAPVRPETTTDAPNPTPSYPPGVEVPPTEPSGDVAQELPSPLENVEPESGTPGLVESDETDKKGS
jgi:hypothetical protein